MDGILDGLNEQQRCAVTCPSNVLQVLAPPGSGKTKTLTTRVAYHIACEGLKPWNMIVCTFTIKAAREMKERIRSFVGEELEKKLVLGTFHSVARRYLSVYGYHIGIPKHFGIADTNDTLAMIKRIVKKLDSAMEPSKARSRISKCKSRLTPARVGEKKMSVKQQEFESIYAMYEEQLKAAKLLDYDDLLLRCVELLRQFPECVSNVQAVLIDEFQDTNHVQYELMNLFAQHRNPGPHGSIPKITIVGDPDQSIYSFRSAEIENLAKMAQRYQDTQVVHLEENYRSSGSILQFAIEVIEQDTSRPQKSLQATHTVGPAPVLRSLSSASKEAAWLVSEIQRSHYLNAGLLNYSDYAVLLRSAALSRLIETELGRAGIPYRMVGGHKFFDRMEVRILLDYLRVISQPDHNDALLRVINVPTRKVGDKAIQLLLQASGDRKQTLWDVIRSISQGKARPPTGLSNQALSGLETFVSIILTAQQKLTRSETTIAELLMHVMQKTRYETFLRTTYKEDYDDRAANVDELAQLALNGKVFAEQEEELIQIDGVEQVERPENGPTEMLAQFLANIALASEADKQDAEKDSPKVVISTIHAAKGLEWPVVFIPAAYDGSIPHSRADNVDEERRLLYVGMTRAKALLYLSCPEKSSMSTDTMLSQFLSTPTIARYFDIKGPSFGWSVSNELARILGRTCPSAAAVEERYIMAATDKANCPSIEDDQFTTGEDADQGGGYDGAYGRLWSTPYEGTGMMSNKRKLPEGFDYAQASSRQDARATGGGFVSASTIKLTTVQEQSHVSNASMNSTGKKSARSSTAQKKMQTGQASLKSFFSSKTMVTGGCSTPTTTSVSQAISSHSSFQPTAQQRVGNAITKTVSRKPYRLPSASIKDRHEDEEASTRYVLLSSSPVKEVAAKDSIHSETEEQEKENNTEERSDNFSSNKSFSSARSMHTTSMDRLQNPQVGAPMRRTLGSRPALGGQYRNTQFKRPTFL